MIQFIKMNIEQFEIYKAGLIKSYAKTLADNLKRSLESTMQRSEQQINSLLHSGADTENHYIFNVLDVDTKEVVGVLWVNAEPKEQRSFIFDIEIKEAYRGKSYGKAVLAELEALMKEMGIKQIGLNVFANNSVALELYKKLGYEITNMNMVKEL